MWLLLSDYRAGARAQIRLPAVTTLHRTVWVAGEKRGQWVCRRLNRMTVGETVPGG